MDACRGARSAGSRPGVASTRTRQRRLKPTGVLGQIIIIVISRRVIVVYGIIVIGRSGVVIAARVGFARRQSEQEE